MWVGWQVCQMMVSFGQRHQLRCLVSPSGIQFSLCLGWLVARRVAVSLCVLTESEAALSLIAVWHQPVTG